MASSRRSHRQRARRGASAVEFAVVLPLISLLVLGAIEAAHAVIVQHTMTEAAQAGCRLYALPDHTQADVENIIDTALRVPLSTHCVVTYDPPNKSGVDTNLEPVTVTLTTNYDDIAWIPMPFFANKTLQVSCILPADTNN